MASEGKAGQRGRGGKREKGRGGGAAVGAGVGAAGGRAGGRASAAGGPEPGGRSLTVDIPVGRAVDVVKMPVSAAWRVLSGKRGGLPVYIGLGVLAVADVIDPPLAAVTGAGYAALRRWGPLRPGGQGAGGGRAGSSAPGGGGE